jgi:tRNA(Ile2)-agmatinylcytidine synthase
MFYVGIDDTDSKKGMCTTYLGALLADELSRYTSIKPKLVRLNPNIRWKTRGNAGICLEMRKKPKGVENLVLETVEEYAEIDDSNTHPGVVFYQGDKVPEEFSRFYEKCLHEVVTIDEAENLAISYGAEICKFKKGRGIIGALASIGSIFKDKTYELIAYREKKNWGKERKIDKKSVFKMNERTFPLTFNNVDNERILIAPHSPCPVLFGIRGEDPETLKRAFNMIKLGERIERKIIYETNQGTDAHLINVKRISDIKPYSSVILEGEVNSLPRVIKGGHVIFTVTDGSDSIECAAYEPTKEFRHIVKKLVPGDKVRVYGGVRSDPKKTINLEKIHVMKLAEMYREENPLCECGRRMESAGKNQGFRCRICKTFKGDKVRVKYPRELEERIYQVPPRAMRHISKPLVRELRTNTPKSSCA